MPASDAADAMCTGILTILGSRACTIVFENNSSVLQGLSQCRNALQVLSCVVLAAQCNQ